MLGTVLLLLALLSGTTALPSEPAGMYRQGDMAQHTPIPVLPYLKQPLIYPAWGNGSGRVEGGVSPPPIPGCLGSPTSKSPAAMVRPRAVGGEWSAQMILGTVRV